MSAETSSRVVEDDLSSIQEAGQGTFTDLDKQLAAVMGNVNSDRDTTMPVSNSKSEDGELSMLPMHKQDVETTSQRARGDYEVWGESNDNASGLPSEQNAEVGESGSRVVGRLEEILVSLRAVALTREEARRAENILWDVKGELYAAEKRGRVEG
jgi:hypothetical protein